ncbi:hypothetical protein J6590_092662 [Homalodisca vitripennis]|nr:hypothetical protein J6590_092662 [Homalodisca vitripennis]
MVAGVDKKSRQCRSSAKRNLEDQWKETEDLDNHSYGSKMSFNVCYIKRISEEG